MCSKTLVSQQEFRQHRSSGGCAQLICCRTRLPADTLCLGRIYILTQLAFQLDGSVTSQWTALTLISLVINFLHCLTHKVRLVTKLSE